MKQEKGHIKRDEYTSPSFLVRDAFLMLFCIRENITSHEVARHSMLPCLLIFVVVQANAGHECIMSLTPKLLQSSVEFDPGILTMLIPGKELRRQTSVMHSEKCFPVNYLLFSVV